MALQPLGPLPPSTYWRRRLVAAAVLLVLLVLLLRACGSSGRPAPLAAPSPSPSPAATDSPLSTPTASQPGSPPASPTGPRSSSPFVPQACGDAVLQVTAVADATSYRTGTGPRFTLTVTNVGKVACRRALGSAAVELRVFSGEDRIWSSGDCARDTGQGLLTLAAGEAQAMTVRWAGKRTTPGCKSGAVAAPGTYRVSARVGAIVRQGTVFDITG